MTEVSNKDEAEKPQDGWSGKGGKSLKYALIGVVAVGVLAVLYVIVFASMKPREAPGLNQLAKGAMQKLTVASAAKPAPTTSFTDTDGKVLTIKDDFKGQVVVVNLWATWCGPCRIEMPTLAKLQSEFAGQPVKVVAISVDRAEDAADARKFVAQHGPLAFYHDPKYAFAFGLEPKAEGLPTTVIFDRTGKEAARLSGDADWSGPDAKAVIDRVLKGD